SSVCWRSRPPTSPLLKKRSRQSHSRQTAKLFYPRSKSLLVRPNAWLGMSEDLRQGWGLAALLSVSHCSAAKVQALRRLGRQSASRSGLSSEPVQHLLESSTRKLLAKSRHPRLLTPSLTQIGKIPTMPPNNSFKPNLLRYTKHMAEKACH